MIPERIIYWAAPALLLIVASIQIALALGGGLDPWKGGGFGMFASIDSRITRQLSFHGLDAEGRVHRIAYDAGDFHHSGIVRRLDQRRLRSLPTQEELQSLADSLLQHDFVVTGKKVADYMKVLENNPRTEGRLVFGGEEGVGSEILKLKRKDRISDQDKRTVELVATRVILWSRSFYSETYELKWQPFGDPAFAGDWNG